MIYDTKYIACSFYTGFNLCSPFTVQYVTRSQNNALIIFKRNNTPVVEKDIHQNSMMHGIFIKLGLIFRKESIFSMYMTNLYYRII